MGRDDAKAVPGLQGGTAPARAFAAFMRYATARRPVEQFDTELKLPEWQLEPDDEAYYGAPDDYQYVDEQGNLIDPGIPQEMPGEATVPRDTGDAAPAPGGLVPVGPPQAAGDDFLDEATGRDAPPPDPRLRQVPPGQRPPLVLPSPRPT